VIAKINFAMLVTIGSLSYTCFVAAGFRICSAVNYCAERSFSFDTPTVSHF